MYLFYMYYIICTHANIKVFVHAYLGKTLPLSRFLSKSDLTHTNQTSQYVSLLHCSY